jgi:predicted Rossmann-fold nucleotide-binding protein
MESKGKNVPRLHRWPTIRRAASTKARESWHMLTIMAEFIDSTERLPELHPAVSIFGSARIGADSPYYALAADIVRRLADAGPAVISGGSPGIMEAADKGAFENKSPFVGLNIELPHELARTSDMTSLSIPPFLARAARLVRCATGGRRHDSP